MTTKRGSLWTGHSPRHLPTCFIAPPDILSRIAERGTPEDREAAIRTLTKSAAIRAQRAAMSSVLRELRLDIAELPFLAPVQGPRVTVYDVEHGGDFRLAGRRIRGDADPASLDEAVNQAYDGSEITRDFYKDVFGRESIDGRALELVSSVHYGDDFDNAFWNGSQMVYGDGSGRIFGKGALTTAIDVIAHELTHGVTEFTAGLEYHKQSGALNEHFSDCFGSLVKQYYQEETADEADWLIGQGILGTALQGEALRSMKAPGTAFDLDRQPASMDDYVDLPDDDDPRNDNGGVHINSGIPNRAFYLVATAIGGYSWERAGQIWYETLTQRLKPTDDFRAAAEATISAAGDLFGSDGSEQKAVRNAWEQVKVLT
jgi:Zn-dependent metalloprotease